MESLHYLLMKSYSVIRRKIFTEAQKIGLTSGQPKILDYLLQYEGSDQKTIAAYCEIEPATLGSILLRMEQNGLIERRQENGNRRSLFVYMTDQGRIVAEQMHMICNTVDAQALKHLTETEAKQLQYLLAKLCDNIDGEEL